MTSNRRTTSRPLAPVRTCVGCRARTTKSDLLRVVAVVTGSDRSAVTLVPDLRGRMPGRGAHLHPDPVCLDLAERRRAFPRALRLAGPLDISALRRYVNNDRQESGTITDGRSMSPQA